jgi:hypothetical protein
MPGLDPLDHDDDGGTVFRDVIMLALAGFMAMVLLLLPHLNPPGEAAKADTKPPGNVIIEATWPKELDTDVDLWVMAPGDRPVGYANKSGLIFNLLRDDLGHRSDVSGINYEVAYSRGMPAGEYVVNLHLYRNISGVLPIPVTVVASVKPSENDSAQQILASEVELTREGQELTVFRFELDESGRLVPGSVHSLHYALRNGRVG